MRPVRNQSEPIYVYVDLGVKNILSFDEKEGILKTTFSLGMLWNDEKLRWNLADFGLQYQNFPKGSVWTPKLYLLNSATKDMALNMADDVDTIHFADGAVLYAELGLATTKCDADVFHYPFDEHSCILDIFGGQSVNFMIVQAINYQYTLATDTNKEWTIMGISKENATFKAKVDFSHVLFTIHFKRKPMFLILNILTPIMVLGLINPVVFVLPEPSGERVSLAVTILLALVFFLTMVSDRLPPISDPISMLNITIMAQVVNSISILIFAIFTMIIFDKKEKNTSVPARVCKLILTLKCKLKKVHYRTSIHLEREVAEHNDDPVCMESESIDHLEEKPGLNVKTQLKMFDLITWGDVGNLVNRVCLIVFSFLIILNWILYLIVMI
jgi:hypothetical protein